MSKRVLLVLGRHETPAMTEELRAEIREQEIVELSRAFAMLDPGSSVSFNLELGALPSLAGSFDEATALIRALHERTDVPIDEFLQCISRGGECEGPARDIMFQHYEEARVRWVARLGSDPLVFLLQTPSLHDMFFWLFSVREDYDIRPQFEEPTFESWVYNLRSVMGEVAALHGYYSGAGKSCLTELASSLDSMFRHRTLRDHATASWTEGEDASLFVVQRGQCHFFGRDRFFSDDIDCTRVIDPKSEHLSDECPYNQFLCTGGPEDNSPELLELLLKRLVQIELSDQFVAAARTLDDLIRRERAVFAVINGMSLDQLNHWFNDVGAIPVADLDLPSKKQETLQWLARHTDISLAAFED